MSRAKAIGKARARAELGKSTRQRRRRERGEKGAERSRFGRELWMLHRGDPIWRVLLSFCGADDGGRIWAQRIADTLLAAFTHDRARRKALETLLRTFEGARMHGSQWRVIDRAGFPGRRTELAPERCVDAETGEVFEHATRLERRHVPKSRAGGLSRKVKRSPRQIDRYRRAFRAGKVIKSQRTTRNMRAVVMPDDDAFWGYAQTWLAFPPSAEMVRRFTGWAAPRQSGFMTSAAARVAPTGSSGPDHAPAGGMPGALLN